MPAEALTLRDCPVAAATALPPEEAALRVELNRATYADLVALPGIGEKTANAILAYREEIGAFRYVEELMQISGIGSGKLGAIYDLIYIDKGE